MLTSESLLYKSRRHQKNKEIRDSTVEGRKSEEDCTRLKCAKPVHTLGLLG